MRTWFHDAYTRPSHRTKRLSGVRVCGARGDTRAGDGARYPTPLGGIVAVGYHLCPGGPGCRTASYHRSQLDSEGRLTAHRGSRPNHDDVNETVIQFNDQGYWLYAAVDPDTNRLLNVRLYPTRATALTEMFPAELKEKHFVDDAPFWSTERLGCRRPVTVTASDSSTTPTGIGIASKASSRG